MDDSLLTHIEAVARTGKVIVSADDCSVVEMVKETITSGRTASFYLTAEQARTVKSWYWTPERIELSGIKVVTDQERTRIESELGLENIGSFRCTRIQCECGHTYGAFEFLQQGIREHGADAVRAVFALRNSSFLRANPALLAICPNCSQLLRGGGIEYDCDGYGGCCYQE
ncbi:hypothetical protein ACGFYQ_19605 [Streptomyces sp. NPDC048258]|uniref:hypothetical protein n=1 Tax=Streptomyces sp. NPDC048258 TaxID=3365527 RepID=UPI00371D3EFE